MQSIPRNNIVLLIFNRGAFGSGWRCDTSRYPELLYRSDSKELALTDWRLRPAVCRDWNEDVEEYNWPKKRESDGIVCSNLSFNTQSQNKECFVSVCHCFE